MECGEIEIAPADEAPLSISENQHGGSQSKENNTTNSLAIQVEGRFQSLQDEMQLTYSDDVCIYRVPKFFMDCKREAYLPEFVSLGPYHHNKHLWKHKLEAVQKTLNRLDGKSIEDLIEVIKPLEKKIRDCYEDSANEYDGETLARMMTMDGCFILEFLRAMHIEGNGKESSLIFRNRGRNVIHLGIWRDILKLENQIPLFILITILNLEFQNDDYTAMWELISMLIGHIVFRSYPFSRKSAFEEIALGMERYIREGACHLLDLCKEMSTDFLTQSSTDSIFATTSSYRTVERRLFVAKCVISSFTIRCNLPTSLGSVSCWLRGREERMNLSREQGMALPDSAKPSAIPRAELLHKAGIRFKTCVEGNVWFEKRTLLRSRLWLPQITVDDSTETILRNLIIFEEYQRLKEKENVFSHYLCFMNELIDSEKDVAPLSKEGIIINQLGDDEEVASLFKNLRRGTTAGGLKVATLFTNLPRGTIAGGLTQFDEVAQQVKAEYKSKLKVWRSQFIAEHCSKPWYIASLVAAILILGMTAVQTVYSVKK